MGSYAGIDWASEKHDLLIADEAGDRLLTETFVHDAEGIGALCGRLVRFEVEVVAIERGDGVLVERLLEAGVAVLALHPNQVKAAGDRFRASGGKSDRFDCFEPPSPARHSGPTHATEWMTGATSQTGTQSANRHPTTRAR